MISHYCILLFITSNISKGYHDFSRLGLILTIITAYYCILFWFITIHYYIFLLAISLPITAYTITASLLLITPELITTHYCIYYYYFVTTDYFRIHYYPLLHLPLLPHFYAITTYYYMLITTCYCITHYYTITSQSSLILLITAGSLLPITSGSITTYYYITTTSLLPITTVIITCYYRGPKRVHYFQNRGFEASNDHVVMAITTYYYHYYSLLLVTNRATCRCFTISKYCHVGGNSRFRIIFA